MRRVFKKQDRNDFNSRIQRLDPAFAKMPAEARFESKPWEIGKSAKSGDSPIMMAGVGFGLALAALFAANNPETVQELMLRSGWPAQFLVYGMNGLSLMIIGLIIFYLVSALRIFNPNATGRWNAAGTVAGAIAAIGVSSMDTTYIDAGLQYAGLESPGEILTIAQARTASLANVDWSSVLMVSSTPK